MKPLPWELKLLLYLKHRSYDSFYLDDFMKRFSAKKLGTKPETHLVG
jgi:hypothetical protein